MKKIMSHLKNNLCIYFIIFSALLSIVSIIAGAAMLIVLVFICLVCEKLQTRRKYHGKQKNS